MFLGRRQPSGNSSSMTPEQQEDLNVKRQEENCVDPLGYIAEFPISVRDTVYTVNMRLARLINVHSKLIQKSIVECGDPEDLKSYLNGWTRLLVCNFYKYGLNLPVTMNTNVQLYGKDRLKSKNGAPMIDYPFRFEENILIDSELWSSVGMQLWIRIVRMIFILHVRDLENISLRTAKELDIDKLVGNFIDNWTPKVYSKGDISHKLLEDLMMIGAKVGKYVATSTSPDIHALKTSLEFFVTTMVMVVPAMLVDTYDTNSDVMTITREQTEVVHESIEYFMNDFRPSSRSYENMYVSLQCLCSYPGIRRYEIIQKMFSDPEKVYENQFNLHLFKPILQRESMISFQKTAWKRLEKFNIVDHGCEYFWRREEDAEVFSNDWKIVLFNELVNSKTSYGGFLTTRVFTSNMLHRWYDFITRLSHSYPVLVKIDPYHYCVYENGVLRSATVDAAIWSISEHISRNGMHKIKGLEDHPVSYEWMKIHPRIVTHELIQNVSSVRKPIVLGHRRLTTATTNGGGDRTSQTNGSPGNDDIMPDL